jgi:outer membrane protein OmpA-like peptidoglycan-associated protein
MVRDNFGNTPQVATAMPQPVHQVRTFALATASAGAASAIHPPPDRASPGLAAAAPVVSGRPGWQQLLERGVSVALARPYWLAAAIGITLAVSLGLWVMDDGATKKRPDEMPAHDGARPALPQAPAGSTTAKPQAKPGGEAQPAAAADVDPDSESPPDTVGKPELSQLTSLPLRFDQGAAHYDVTDEARLREVVQTIVAALRRDDSLRVEVGGHTSREGSATINKRLGQRRADAVRQFLVEQGVGADRIVMRNYATKKPATAAGKAAAREMNRRVTVRLVP